MFFVYILLSLKDNRTYIGSTNNLERRISEHNNHKAKATKFRAPFRLILSEEFLTRAECMNREKWWKSGAGRRHLKEIFSKVI